jgi:predicted GNAT superfamily acetyltransferase
VKISLRVLDSPEEMLDVEAVQRQVWTGAETDLVPVHMLIAASHNGGLVIGAYDEEALLGPLLVGFVYGFPGMYTTPDGPRLKHCSHMMGVLPAYRDQGIGFLLKRAQWQLVRHQGLDRITWTYDPLFSRNAHLNIARLGAVCNTYICSIYGELRDDINAGLPSDRFQVDWWVNSVRVNRRLSRRPRQSLDLAHFLAAGTEVLNPTQMGADGQPHPTLDYQGNVMPSQDDLPAICLVEIPSDFPGLKTVNPGLALDWRLHIRAVFQDLFARDYLVTDFVHLPGTMARSFYVLSYGESTL